MENRIMVLTSIDAYTMETVVGTFSSFELLRKFVLTLLPEKDAYSLIKNDTLFSSRNNTHYLIHYTTLDLHA